MGSSVSGPCWCSRADEEREMSTKGALPGGIMAMSDASNQAKPVATPIDRQEEQQVTAGVNPKPETVSTGGCKEDAGPSNTTAAPAPGGSTKPESPAASPEPEPQPNATIVRHRSSRSASSGEEAPIRNVSRVNGDCIREDAKKFVRKELSTGKRAPFPSRPLGSRLTSQAWNQMRKVFEVRANGSDLVTKESVEQHFKCPFKKLSIDAMFREVDVDGNGGISAEEFVDFWVHVRKAGYPEKDILCELESLEVGAAWVDWNDGRETDGKDGGMVFPTRKLFSRVSHKTWQKCEELYREMDKQKKGWIDLATAEAFFGRKGEGSFAKLSANSFMNEMDVEISGRVTPAAFMEFWDQVRKSGYKNVTLVEEIDLILDGGSWVDWKDTRTT